MLVGKMYMNIGVFFYIGYYDSMLHDIPLPLLVVGMIGPIILDIG